MTTTTTLPPTPELPEEREDLWTQRTSRTCPGCGLKRVGADGRCEVCGALKRPPPAPPDAGNCQRSPRGGWFTRPLACHYEALRDRWATHLAATTATMPLRSFR